MISAHVTIIRFSGATAHHSSVGGLNDFLSFVKSAATHADLPFNIGRGLCPQAGYGNSGCKQDTEYTCFQWSAAL